MNNLTNIINLVLGDWSDDGHGKTHTIPIKSNLDKKSIEEAYSVGCKKLRFDFINDVCEGYEDNLLPLDKFDILVTNGFVDVLNKDSDYIMYLDQESYTNIFLFIIKLGNKKFQYESLRDELNPSINIGGYGLFY